MTATVTVGCAGVLIVFEGASRLQWCRTAVAEWVPTGIWPDHGQAGEINDRIARREPLLILLECGDATVEVMAEEFAPAPVAIAALAVDPDADVVTLQIPFLDWLPPALRRRGTDFASAVRDQIAGTPKVLLPNLVLEPVDVDTPWIRFGCRVSGRTPANLDMIARHAFEVLTRPGLMHIERHARAC